jgi:hypothetical protein
MAQTYANEISGLYAVQPLVVKPSAVSAYGAHPKRFRASIPLKSQSFGAGNEVLLATVPPGAVFSFGVIVTDTSLGTCTVAVGIAGAPTKYKAATMLTAADVPAIFGPTAQVGQSAMLYEEQIFLQVLVANLPASGNLVVDLYFSSAT